LFLIDTNIAIHLRDGLAPVMRKVAEHDGFVALSALSLAELQRGLYKSRQNGPLRQARLATILKSVAVLPFDLAAAEIYGQIIAQIGWVKGRDYDRMIGAHAMASRRILVTANIDDFRDIPGLRLEDWTASI
jgi:tRNA(fMet)-specific endonuclease VapC